MNSKRGMVPWLFPLPGPTAASEPETQAIINNVRKNFPKQWEEDEMLLFLLFLPDVTR
jgi:hypothetical protein